HRREQDVEREQVCGVEAEVQPLFRSVELDQVAEEAQRLGVGHAKGVDLHQLDDVLEDVYSLNDNYRDEQRTENADQHCVHLASPCTYALALRASNGEPGRAKPRRGVARPSPRPAINHSGGTSKNSSHASCEPSCAFANME